MLRDALAAADIEWDEPEPGHFVVTLPGEHKQKTACSIVVGAHALSVNAFVARHADENHEELVRLEGELLEIQRRAAEKAKKAIRLINWMGGFDTGMSWTKITTLYKSTVEPILVAAMRNTHMNANDEDTLRRVQGRVAKAWLGGGQGMAPKLAIMEMGWVDVCEVIRVDQAKMAERAKALPLGDPIRELCNRRLQ